MNPSWKEIAASPIYKEYKAAFIKEYSEINTINQIGKRFCDYGKRTLKRDFIKLIGRANHIAHHFNITIIQALEKIKKDNCGYAGTNTACIFHKKVKNNPLAYQQKKSKTGRRVYPKARWDTATRRQKEYLRRIS